MPFIKTTDGCNIFYHDWSSNQASASSNPVVFIHGWPLNADMWEYQLPVLAAQGLRCIAYDRRGFGRSDQPWTGYDYDTFASDLNDLLSALDLTNVTLVGFSMGGGEIARYLSRYGSQRIARSVLVSAVTPYLLKTKEHPDGTDHSVFDDMVDGLNADRPHFLADFGKKFFGAGLLNFSVSNEILQWASMHALKASPKATIDCVRAFSQTDFRDDLSAFTMPTLIIHGTADNTVPIDISARKAAELIPGSTTLLEYEGEPHGLFFTAKDRLTQDLLDFVQSGQVNLRNAA